jgi:threonine synthase
MGFYFKAIIAAHNANDTIPRYMASGEYHPGKTIATLANAMDVNDPGNFVRLQYLQQQQYRGRLARFEALSVADHEILHAIREVWDQHKYLLDPHTATAWHMLNRHGSKGVIIATAHPYKFENVIIKALGHYPEGWIKHWEKRPIDAIPIPAEYSVLKNILQDKLSD